MRKTEKRQKTRSLRLESLERRALMAADLTASAFSVEENQWLQSLVEETASVSQAESARASSVISEKVIVELKSKEVAKAFSESLGNVTQLGRTEVANKMVTVTFVGAGVAEQLATVFHSNPLVELFEIDSMVQVADLNPNDPFFGNLDGLHNTGQRRGVVDADIDAPEAWQVTTGESSVVVAVIDSGVDYTHQDLDSNIWVNPGEVPGNGIDDDGNGFVDDVHGYDFWSNDPDPMDGGTHGTHVAGTIAAEGNNAIGVVGVAPDIKIMPIRFLGPRGGFTSDAIRALDYAVSNGAKISNNSWGGGSYSRMLVDAISRTEMAGHIFVAAAGNSGADNDKNPHYPASYDSNNIISVAATDSSDRLASFSNTGFNSVDIAAPGVSTYSTLPGNRYGYMSGTSMATPHVSGVVALTWSLHPEWTADQVISNVIGSGDARPQLSGKIASGARLNAAQALSFNGVVLKGDTLKIIGDDDADDFVVWQDAGHIHVSHGGTLKESFSDDAVGQIMFFGRGGHDVFRNRTGIPVTGYGGAGNDQLFGGWGRDRLYGESGNDRLDGGDHHDTLDGGNGNDVLLGGYGNDALFGREGRDVLYAGPGNDRVEGGSGADSIDAGDGDDHVLGQGGNDRIWGRQGNDRVDGGAGDDRIFGDYGNDFLYGGRGNDLIDGGDGDDRIYGQGGDDKILGRGGKDHVYGGAGDDRIYGGKGKDVLYGGRGNDLIDGGQGADKLDGFTDRVWRNRIGRRFAGWIRR